MRNPKKVHKLIMFLAFFWGITNILSVNISEQITEAMFNPMHEVEIPTWMMFAYFSPFVIMIFLLALIAWFFHLKSEEAKAQKRKEEERIKYEALMNCEQYRKTRRY